MSCSWAGVCSRPLLDTKSSTAIEQHQNRRSRNGAERQRRAPSAARAWRIAMCAGVVQLGRKATAVPNGDGASDMNPQTLANKSARAPPPWAAGPTSPLGFSRPLAISPAAQRFSSFFHFPLTSPSAPTPRFSVPPKAIWRSRHRLHHPWAPGTRILPFSTTPASHLACLRRWGLPCYLDICKPRALPYTCLDDGPRPPPEGLPAPLQPVFFGEVFLYGNISQWWTCGMAEATLHPPPP